MSAFLNKRKPNWVKQHPKMDYPAE
jgi:hypothetical protein